MSSEVPEPVPGSSSDPTRVMNQPALRTSSGTVWLIAASVFVAICLVPLIGIVLSGGAAATVALVASVLLVGLLAAMFVVRFTVHWGPYRLRRLAACMLAMAVVALIAMIVCVMIVWAPLMR